MFQITFPCDIRVRHLTEDHGKKKDKSFYFIFLFLWGSRNTATDMTFSHVCVKSVCCLCGGVRIQPSLATFLSAAARLTPGWLALEFPDNAPVSTLSPSSGHTTEITDVFCDIQLFTWVLGTELGLSDFPQPVLTPVVPSPQPRTVF